MITVTSKAECVATVDPAPLYGRVNAVSSKSFAHRILIAAALFSKIPVTVVGITPSMDIEATCSSLRALGAKIETAGDRYTVTPPELFPQTAILPCMESGSTLRFFIPIAASLGVQATFTGTDRLFERPNDALLQTLKTSGVTMQNRTLTGRLTAGYYELDASVSSQYVTGMLFALSLAKGDSTLVLRGNTVSSAYVEITLEVLRSFGVQIEKTPNGFFIKGGNLRLCTPKTPVLVEGDWSNAAFFLAAGAIGGEVELGNLNAQSCQGDRAIYSILKQMGADIAWQNGNLRVKKRALIGTTIDAENIPDLVPILSVLAAYAEGKTVISGVSRLTLKESDRLSGILKMLKEAQIKAQSDGKTLTIYGGTPQGGRFYSENDHRMVMCAAVLAAQAKGSSTIIGANAVRKSYPHFFKDFILLGGKANGCLEGE